MKVEKRYMIFKFALPSDFFFERVKFSLISIVVKFPDMLNCPLQVKHCHSFFSLKEITAY